MAWQQYPVSGGVNIWWFSQTAASSTWSINHAMGVMPAVSVQAYDNSGILQEAFPLEIVQVDNNNVQILWSSPRTGIVTFIGA